MRKVGKGRVYAGMSANEVLAALGVPRDWEYTKPEARYEPDVLAPQARRRRRLFRRQSRGSRRKCRRDISREGKAPELWDPATGETQPASYRIADGRTTVPLHLDPYGSTFVVFREPATQSTLQLPAPKETAIGGLDDALNRDWKVSFEQESGAPETCRVPASGLLDRNADSDSDEGIKYFSGTATYSKTIDIPADDLTKWRASVARSWRRA